MKNSIRLPRYTRFSRFEGLENRAYFAAYIAGNPTAYAKIQAAVDAAAPGATINVDAGNYAEMVTIGKQLTIRGARAGVDARTRTGTETVLTGATTTNGVTAGFYVVANNVTIDGFTVQGQTTKSTSIGAGIVLGPSIYGSRISNNIIQNNVAGLYLSNNSPTVPVVIEKNVFRTNNNAGANGGRGIYTDGGISGGNLTNVIIDSNTFTNNSGSSGTTGLEAAIAFEARSAGRQSNIRVTNNFESGNGKGMLFFNTTGVLIQGNSVTTSKDWYSGALRFEGNNHDVTIAYNNIYSNTGPGVAVDSNGTPGDNSGFSVNRNNIYGNGTTSAGRSSTSGGKLGVVFNQSVYEGTFDATNNYWGAANGPGGDGPGTGDTIYGNAYKTTAWIVAKGGAEIFSPWLTSSINITNLPLPAAVTQLTATAVSSDAVNLAWKATVGTALVQYVQRSTDGVNFTNIASVSPLVKTYADTGLTAGQKYFYRVIAANNTGNAGPSNIVNVVPPAYAAPAAPGGLAVASTTSTTAVLTWVAPANTVGVTGYTIYRNGAAVGTATGTTFTDTGLLAGTTYTYAVATNDNRGAVSAKTPNVTAVTKAAQLADTGFETTRVAAANYAYNPTTANWAFGGRSGIAANGSAWGAANAPDGTQVAFLQSNAAGSSITQTLTTPAGNYTISFSAAQRNGYAVNPVAVKIDGMLVGMITPGSTAFAAYATASFALTAGSHTIAFSGTANTGDTASFIDGVSLNAIAPAVVPAAPSELTATGISKTQIALTWQPAGTNPVSYTLLRSTDGTNFATLSTSISGAATSYTDATGAAGTKYYYRLVAVNAVGSSPVSNTASATTLAAAAVTTPLSGLNWTSATTGYGSVEKNANASGDAINLNGTVYASGIGTHSSGSIVYNLNGAYNTFQSDIGIDYRSIGKPVDAVYFQVIGDGKVLFDSGPISDPTKVVSVNVDVTGVKTLTLVNNAVVAGEIDYAHVDWAGARLVANPQAPAAPTGVTAAVLSTSSIKVGWTAAAGASVTGYTVERSLDGTTWATAGTVGGSVLTFTDTGLASATSYSYRVRATNPTGDSANSTVATATTLSSAAVTTQLSSLNWSNATAGYGNVQKNANASGDALSINGVSYASGIGTHASSIIVYDLAGAYATFQSDIGFDGRSLGKPVDAVYFQVIGDGQVLYDSGSVSDPTKVLSVSVDITGVQTLMLVANAVVPGSIDYGHVDWANARLTSTPSMSAVSAASSPSSQMQTQSVAKSVLAAPAAKTAAKAATPVAKPAAKPLTKAAAKAAAAKAIAEKKAKELKAAKAAKAAKALAKAKALAAAKAKVKAALLKMKNALN